MQVSQFIIDDPRTREDLEEATCGICHKIALHPMQCRSTHLFCSDCIQAHLQHSHTCPSGHALLPSELSPCRFAERLVSRLMIRCPNSSPPFIAAVRRRLRHFPGCRWTGAVRDLPLHAGTCVFRQTVCALCKSEVPVLSIDAHTRICRNGRVCDLCGASVSDIYDHYQVCEKVAVYCPNLCHVQGEACLLRRCEIEDHLKICPQQLVKCEFWEMGCRFEGERAAIQKHVKEGLSDHLLLMGKGLTRVREMEERVRRIEERLATIT